MGQTPGRSSITNALASGFARANPAAAPARILDAWHARRFTLVVSNHLLTELSATFENPYFSRRLTSQRIAEHLLLLTTRALIVPISVSVEGVATHPEDDLVLATAVLGNAAYLVTGDAQLLRLGEYRGVTVLSPRAFLNLLNGEPATINDG